MLRLELLIIREGLRFTTVVFRDNNFVIRIGRLLKNRAQASLKDLLVILIRNNNGNPRLALHRVHAAEAADVTRKLHPGRDPQTVIMLLHRPFPALIGVHLALWIARRGILVSPPVIKEFRNMHDLPRLLAAAEDEIVILGSVKLAALKTPVRRRGDRHRAPHTENMRNIIITAQKIDIKIRLEIRAVILVPLRHLLILVRVDHVGGRILIERPHDLIDRIRL